MWNINLASPGLKTASSKVVRTLQANMVETGEHKWRRTQNNNSAGSSYTNITVNDNILHLFLTEEHKYQTSTWNEWPKEKTWVDAAPKIP